MENTFILPELRESGEWYTQFGPIYHECGSYTEALIWFIERCEDYLADQETVTLLTKVA